MDGAWEGGSNVACAIAMAEGAAGIKTGWATGTTGSGGDAVGGASISTGCDMWPTGVAIGMGLHGASKGTDVAKDDDGP